MKWEQFKDYGVQIQNGFGCIIAHCNFPKYMTLMYRRPHHIVTYSIDFLYTMRHYVMQPTVCSHAWLIDQTYWFVNDWFTVWSIDWSNSQTICFINLVIRRIRGVAHPPKWPTPKKANWRKIKKKEGKQLTKSRKLTKITVMLFTNGYLSTPNFSKSAFPQN